MRRLRAAPALVAFVAYYVTSLVVGEAYPFSRYSMYSGAGYHRGAVLVFRADGREASIDAYDRFAGFDAGMIAYPPGEHFGSEYKLDEVRHRLESHRVVGTEPRGAVDFEIGVRIVEASDEGPRIVAPFVRIAEGRAWPSD